MVYFFDSNKLKELLTTHNENKNRNFCKEHNKLLEKATEYLNHK